MRRKPDQQLGGDLGKVWSVRGLRLVLGSPTGRLRSAILRCSAPPCSQYQPNAAGWSRSEQHPGEGALLALRLLQLLPLWWAHSSTQLGVSLSPLPGQRDDPNDCQELLLLPNLTTRRAVNALAQRNLLFSFFVRSYASLPPAPRPRLLVLEVVSHASFSRAGTCPFIFSTYAGRVSSSSLRPTCALTLAGQINHSFCIHSTTRITFSTSTRRTSSLASRSRLP